MTSTPNTPAVAADFPSRLRALNKAVSDTELRLIENSAVFWMEQKRSPDDIALSQWVPENTLGVLLRAIMIDSPGSTVQQCLAAVLAHIGTILEPPTAAPAPGKAGPK